MVGPAFDFVVVSDFVFFVDNGLLSGAVASGDVASFVRHDKRNATGFIMVVARQNHGSVGNDTGHALEAGGREQSDRNDGDPALPQVPHDVAQLERSFVRHDLSTPLEAVPWREVRSRHGLAQIAHRGGRNADSRVHCRTKPTWVRSTNPSELGAGVPRRFQRVSAARDCVDRLTEEAGNANLDVLH